MRLLGRHSSAGRSGEKLGVNLSALPADVHSVVVAATMSGGSFNELVDLDLLVSASDCKTPALRVDLSGAGAERAYVAVELYRRASEWKIRAVGQGWNSGLAGLSAEYGVDIEPGAAPPAIASASSPTVKPNMTLQDFSAIVEWFEHAVEDRRAHYLKPYETAKLRLTVLSQSRRKLAVDPAGRRAYKQARLNEAAAYSGVAEARTKQLTSILADSMQSAGQVRERLTRRPSLPPFNPGPLTQVEEAPQLHAYLPPQPTGLTKVFGRDRHAQAMTEAHRARRGQCSIRGQAARTATATGSGAGGAPTCEL